MLLPASIGHVSVERAGTTTFAPATNGESLHVGDTIQTDGVGLAEIDYATNSYTRLDINTTFKITKLTDSQGDRQVDGTLQSGQTWNRTVALTQSQSFDQEGAGTTAAVAGTAFVVDCTTPTTCTFTAVIDNVDLTGSAGQTQILNPLTQCVSTSGNLCATSSQLTPDQLALIQWIQLNVFLDLTEHGLGNGVFDPFGGTVNVTNGVVQTFSPSSAGQGFTPQTSPPPPAPEAPTIDTSNPVLAGGPYRYSDQDPAGDCTEGSPTSFNPYNVIETGDDCSVDFKMNVKGDGARPFFIQFTQLTDSLGTLFDQTLGRVAVALGFQYQPTDIFTFHADDNDSSPDGDTGSTSFIYQAVDTAMPELRATQEVTVLVDCDADDHTGACAASLSTAIPSTPAGPSTAASITVTTPPTTTVTTTPTTTQPAGASPTP